MKKSWMFLLVVLFFSCSKDRMLLEERQISPKEIRLLVDRHALSQDDSDWLQREENQAICEAFGNWSANAINPVQLALFPKLVEELRSGNLKIPTDEFIPLFELIMNQLIPNAELSKDQALYLFQKPELAYAIAEFFKKISDKPETKH